MPTKFSTEIVAAAIAGFEEQKKRLDALRDRAGEKMKDGRHVGLDFYDLLIEALRSNIALYLGYTPSIADSSSGDARMTLKGGYGITLAFVGLRTGPLLKMTKPIRIAANSHQVTLTDVIRRQLFEVTNLEFWRLTLTSTHFFQALQSFQ